MTTTRKRAKAAAEPANNLTETPEATARRLAGELEQKTAWWRMAEQEKRRLQSRVAELEALCLAISVLSRKASDEERRDPDDCIPF